MKNEEFIKLLPLETERLIIRKVSTKDVDLMLKMDSQEIKKRSRKNRGEPKRQGRKQTVVP